jgi:hypothetical protein
MFGEVEKVISQVRPHLEPHRPNVINVELSGSDCLDSVRLYSSGEVIDGVVVEHCHSEKPFILENLHKVAPNANIYVFR